MPALDEDLDDAIDELGPIPAAWLEVWQRMRRLRRRCKHVLAFWARPDDDTPWGWWAALDQIEEQLPPWGAVTVKRAAREHGLDRARLRRAVEAGELAGVRVGPAWYVLSADVEAWVRERARTRTRAHARRAGVAVGA